MKNLETVSRRGALKIGGVAGLSAGLAAGLATPTAAWAKDGDKYKIADLMAPTNFTDRPLGNVDAKVTIIEYASPTCPHCASFHNTIWPDLKEQYVDTDKIQFILRPFARNGLDAAVFLVAMCATDDLYHPILEEYFRTIDIWARSDTPREAIFEVAKQAGFTQEQFDECLGDKEKVGVLNELRNQAGNDFDLQATPTFYINGKQLSGVLPMETLSKEIDPLL